MNEHWSLSLLGSSIAMVADCKAKTLCMFLNIGQRHIILYAILDHKIK